MVEYFQKLFTEGGTLGIVAQIIGIFGMIATVGSFQMKTQKSITVMQLCAGFLWTTHMMMLGAWAGAVMNGISIFRAAVFMFRKSHAWARHYGWRIFFILLCAGGAAFSAFQGDEWWALLPLCGMILTTFALSCDHPFFVRLFMLCNDPFWLIYNINSGSISGTLTESLNIISAISGMLRLDLPAYLKTKRGEALDDGNKEK